MTRVAIVGGGPAGSALAARLGARAVLFERETFPRDKLCGEFLSYEAVGELEELGVRPPEAVEYRSIRFYSAAGREVEITFPRPALGISRRALDAALLNAARRAGAEVREGTEVLGLENGALRLADGSLSRADAIVGAYGRREKIDSGLSRRFASRRHAFVGMQRHFRGRTENDIEMRLFDGGYCGINRIENGLVNVCLLLEQRFLERLETPRWDGVMKELAPRIPLLRGLEPEGEARAVAQIPFERKEPAESGVLFIGDAAGVMPPLCGDGQSIALRSAKRLAELIEDARERDWPAVWRREFEPALSRGRLLQRGLLYPAVAEAAAFACARWPALGAGLLKATR